MTTTRNAGTGRTAMRGAAAKPRIGGAAAARVLGAVAGFMRQRPGVVLAVIAIGGGGGYVGWNALMQQANRHPAPLFGSRAAGTVEPPRRPELAASVPLPAPRPEIAPVSTTQSIPETPRAAGPDPIGTLIRASSSPPPARAPEARTDLQRVLTAQKALSKLGYGPLKPDGVMGLTTKQAVERFERDHNLPVTGGLTSRTSRQLASASGLQIE